ncbi:MAG TPA: sodium/proton-translocating pyrophosphatase, partial [Demequina sp.]|nr:sodium/proton-translocating pyrophosphatase [Demequina sp.]
MHQATVPGLEFGQSSIVIVVVIGVVAAAALLLSLTLRQQVLRAGDGTTKMKEIAQAIQEGAAAYLNRQLRTLIVFAAVVFGLLFLLPGDTGVRIGRSVFFLVGAFCSASIGYMGMWLAVRANVRVASAATEPGGREKGARIAFRTGGAVGMGVVGQGLAGAAAVVFLFREDAPAVLEGFG